MSDLQAIEAATGAKLERVRQWNMLTAEFTDDVATLGDDMKDELLALVMRLVGERDAERAKFAFYPKTQTAYSEVLHRAKKAEAALANRPIQYEPIPVDESADELVAVLKERDDAKADLAYMTTQRDDEHAALLRRHADLAALKAEVDAPWHIGAFIEVDGWTVGPHMVRSWREELAALKARQCETCRWQEQGAMDPDSCAVLQGVIPCRDFGCNQWQPREAAE